MERLPSAFPEGLLVEAQTPLPTRYGTFQVYVFRHVDDPEPDREHVAVVSGNVKERDNVPIRMHSECLTSEVLGSLKCDCREQLESALDYIGSSGLGVVLYLRQEGRGIGLANKIRAYALQTKGVDTVDANRELGLPDDARTYQQSAAMLRWLGVKSVLLMSNNPEKRSALESLGMTVSDMMPVLIPPNPHSLGYLLTKRDRMQHRLPAQLADIHKPRVKLQ